MCDVDKLYCSVPLRFEPISSVEVCGCNVTCRDFAHWCELLARRNVATLHKYVQLVV